MQYQMSNTGLTCWVHELEETGYRARAFPVTGWAIDDEGEPQPMVTWYLGRRTSTIENFQRELLAEGHKVLLEIVASDLDKMSQVQATRLLREE
jgi:hypothetical protein